MAHRLVEGLALDIVKDVSTGLKHLLDIEKGLVYQSPIIKIHGNPVKTRPKVTRQKHSKNVYQQDLFLRLRLRDQQLIQQRTANNHADKCIHKDHLEPVKRCLSKLVGALIESANRSNTTGIEEVDQREVFNYFFLFEEGAFFVSFEANSLLPVFVLIVHASLLVEMRVNNSIILPFEVLQILAMQLKQHLLLVRLWIYFVEFIILHIRSNWPLVNILFVHVLDLLVVFFKG